ncbi:MAG: single-stranded-DNA-specific exonuclease RecJ [Kiritimatiellales bacterium]
MSANWKFKPVDEALAERFALDLNLPQPVAVLLVQRGCRTVEDAERFLNPSLAALRDPFELPDMDKAVERILHALSAGEPITVFGDYDVDGICSTAMLVRILRELGGRVSTYIPSRFTEGYGLSAEALQACLEEHSPALIITVDCGSNSTAAVELARTAGVDVVVTDHHELSGAPAPAVAVVNPKCAGDHPAKILAGVGVTFKLCHAILKTGRARGCTLCAAVDLRKYLDFVAVATVTDMVPLIDENRTLVRAGFQMLENSHWAGWNALKKLAGVDGAVQCWHAGFALGPRINAAGRTGSAAAALELLLTDLPARAEELAAQLDAANRERQEIERGIVDEAVAEIDAYFDKTKHYGLVIARSGWHPGVIGIVASRLVARYHRPVAVIGMDGNSGRGSCRSIDAFNVLEGLGACADLLKQYGGHSMAAGLEVQAENLDAFKIRFNAAAAAQLQNIDLQPVIEINSTVSLADISPAMLDGVKRSGPFGQDNREPVWAVFGVTAEDCRILQDKHLKLTLSDGIEMRDAIGFNLAEKLPAGNIDVAFTLQENVWNGRTTLQLHIKDIRTAARSDTL